MKKTFIFLFALLLGFSLQAQIKKNSSITVTKSKTLAGAIQPLSAQETYDYILPDKLNFWTRTPGVGNNPGGVHNSLTRTAFRMKAKQDKNNPNYTFTVITDGIENLSPPEIITLPDSSKFIVYTYTFSCKMELRNKDGELLKTFILSPKDYVYTCRVAPNFLDEINSTTPSSPPAFRGENTEIFKWHRANEVNVLIRMEYDMLKKMSSLGSSVITSGYGFPRVNSNPLIMGLDKKDIVYFPELNRAIEAFKPDIEKAFSEHFIDQEFAQQLIKSGDFFASQYTLASEKAMIQLCALNAGFAYLLGGDTEKAHKHLLEAYKIFPILNSAQGTIALFAPIAFLNQLRGNNSVINIIQYQHVSDYETIK